ASTYQASGDSEQALTLYRQAAEGMEKLNFQHRYARRMIESLIECLDRAKQYSEGEAWCRKLLALAKEPGRADALAESAALAALGQNLLKQEKWIDAEPHLRACVALREKSQPDDWRTF